MKIFSISAVNAEKKYRNLARRKVYAGFSRASSYEKLSAEFNFHFPSSETISVAFAIKTSGSREMCQKFLYSMLFLNNCGEKANVSVLAARVTAH